MSYILLNDKALHEKDAVIPVSDRGFRYGDGVFETIRVEQGVPYRFEWHMERLRNGLAAIRIPYELSSMQQACARLLHMNNCIQGLLRIQITRGSCGSGYLPRHCAPTILIETLPLTPVPDEPVSLWVTDYCRIPQSSLPVHSKLSQGLNSTLARMDATEHGCFDAVQLNMQGMVCETSSANIIWLKDNTLYTPALACGVLDGSTRAALLELSAWPVREVHIPLTELEQADAVCITNVSWQAVTVNTLQPQGFTWESTGFAGQLKQLLAHDRMHYITTHGHLWQKT